MTFAFLDLPPELRVQIYKYLLKVPGGIRPTKSGDSCYMLTVTTKPIIERFKSSVETSDQLGGLDLMLVSRQLHHEASEILYGHNTFQFFDLDYLPYLDMDCKVNDFDQIYPWLVVIGRRNRSLIRSLELLFAGGKVPLDSEIEDPIHAREDPYATHKILRKSSDMHYLIEAMKTLAPGNNLRLLNIDFDLPLEPFYDKSVPDFCVLFRRSSSKLLEAILLLKGVEELRSEGMSLIQKTYPDVWEAFKSFKRKMEARWPRVVEAGSENDDGGERGGNGLRESDLRDGCQRRDQYPNLLQDLLDFIERSLYQ